VDETITLCPCGVQGFLTEDGYLNRDKSLGKYIITEDGILSSQINTENGDNNTVQDYIGNVCSEELNESRYTYEYSTETYTAQRAR
jgi:hypothetical protein